MGQSDDAGAGHPYAELYRQYLPRILNYIRLRVDGEDLAQDLTATVFERAIAKQHTLRRQEAFAAWLFRIARNRRIDLVRRDKSGRLDPDDPVFQPDEPEPADMALDAEQRDERVREALKELPAEQLELVRKAFYLGQSHSQIAEETGLPLGTVKSRIRLAFARMRAALESDARIDTDFP